MLIFMIMVGVKSRRPFTTADSVATSGKGGEMLERDLQAAEIAKVDDSGGIVDFHSLRHTFGTLLAASGVHPKIAQDLMRHSTITLTMDSYTHTTLESRMGALGKLPDLRAAKGEQGTAFA